MPEPKPKSEVTDLVAAEDSLRLAKLRAERKELRKKVRATRLDDWLLNIKMESARVVNLKRFAFAADEDLAAAGLTSRQKALVRQWEQPKRLIAFAVEAASRLVESEVRGRVEDKRSTVNVENMTVIQLPEKRDETVAPVYVDVSAEDK